MNTTNNLILRKSVHLGILLISDSISNEKQYGYILDSFHNVLSLCVDANIPLKKYIMFQYKEGTQYEAIFVGNLNDFTVKTVFSHNEDALYDENYNTPLLAITKMECYNGNTYYYFINSDIILKTNTIGGYLNIYEKFNKEETILLDYIFKEDYTELSGKDIYKKIKEIKEYINSLDLKSIINSFEIKVMEHYFTKREMYHSWLSCFIDTKDRYIISLFPHETSFKGTNWEDDDTVYVSESTISKRQYYMDKIDDYKKEAINKYNRDEHTIFLLSEFINKEQTEKKEYYKKIILPKIQTWGIDYKLQYILDTTNYYKKLCTKFDFQKIFNEYNNNLLEIDENFFYFKYKKVEK